MSPRFDGDRPSRFKGFLSNFYRYSWDTRLSRFSVFYYFDYRQFSSTGLTTRKFFLSLADFISMNILLVEPDFQITYPNLALMKISSKHKRKGNNIKYIKGELPLNNDLFSDDYYNPHTIYIATMFTYQSEKTISCINYYKNNFKDSKIIIGGIFSTLMPEYILKKTGITPFVRYSKSLDKIKPDYDLVKEMIKYSPKIERWKNCSFLFSSRGCPRSCKFCSVKRLEPNIEIIENWRDLIDYNKKQVVFFDNNLTAFEEHFDNVINHVIEKNLSTCFNNGFDVRIMTDKQINLLSKVRWQENGLRVAFDNMSEDGHAQRIIKKLLELGVPKYAIMTYVLFNFNDTLEEAMYRATEIKNLGVRPYPQLFKPLDLLHNNVVPSKNWTIELAREFRSYWLWAAHFKKKTFEEYLKEKNKNLKDLLPS